MSLLIPIPPPPQKALVLQGVHARDAAGPRGRARGSITELSIALGSGVHAILGAPEDGTFALLDVLTGEKRPIRGKVLVDGRDPAKTPAIRARIGALLPEPRLPPATSVGAAVRLALQARGEAGHRIDAVLDPLGLSSLHARKVSSLSFAEARAVELALALTTPSPLLLALHEPLGDVAVQNHHLLLARLRELATARACVIITTSSPADARALADRIHVLYQGFLAREVSGDGHGLAPDAPVELTAWVAPSAGGGAEAARALAGALAGIAAVHGVSWEDGRPDRGPDGDGAAIVRVRSESVEAAALAITDAALATGVILEAIAPSSPTLQDVRKATGTLLQMRLAARRRPPMMPGQAAQGAQGPHAAPGPQGAPGTHAAPHAGPVSPDPHAAPDAATAPGSASASAPGSASASAPGSASASAPRSASASAPAAVPAPASARAPAAAPDEPDPPRSVPILPGPPDTPVTPVNEGER